MRRERGFSLIELVVTVAIMGFLIFMLVALQRELVTFDRKMKVDLFSQPNTSSVIHRLRRDVINAMSYYYSDEPYAGYEWSEKTMLLAYPPAKKNAEESWVVVWDFSDEENAKRIEFVDEEIVSEWSTDPVARYTLNYDYVACRPSQGMVDCEEIEFVRLLGYDAKGGLVVDEKIAPALLR